MTPSGSSTGNDQLLKAINSLTTAVNNISKMMSSQPSAGRRAGSPYRGGTSSGNGGINGDNTARRKRSVDDEYHRNRRTAKLQSKDINRLYIDFGKLNLEVNKLRKGLYGTHADLDIASKKQNEYVKTILESSKVTAKFQHGFQKQVDTLLKSSKSMNHIKFQGTTPRARMKEVVNMQETAQGLIAQSNKLKADRKVSNVTSLASGDIKSLAKSMSDSGFSIEGMDIDAFNQRLDSHDHRIRQKKREINHAKKHKHDPARIQALQAEMGDLRAKKEKFLARTIGTTTSSLEGLNKGITDGTRATFHAATAGEIMDKGFQKLNMTTWGAVGALSVLWDAFWKYAKYVQGLAKQQLGGMHFDIGIQSLAVGASTEQFVKTMKQNAFQATQIGFGKFTQAIKNNTATLNKMGLFGDDAVETFGDFAQTLTGMGVHPKDTKRFNAAFKEYAEQAQNMSVTTGISVKEYNALNNQLVNSAETQEMMMRLSKEEREVKVKSLITERDRIAKMVGSNEQAQRFIETLQKVNASKFDKRIDNSMKVLQVSQYLGMGNDGRRLAALMRKRPDELSKDDIKEMNDIRMELGARKEAAKKSGRLNEPLIDALDEMLADLEPFFKEGAQAKLAAENKGSITPGQEKAMADQAQIGKGWQAILTAKSFWDAAISNPIISAIRTLTAVIVGYIALKNKDRILDFFRNGGIDKLKNGGLGGLKDILTKNSKTVADTANAAKGAASAAKSASSAASTAAGAVNSAAGNAPASTGSKVAGAIADRAAVLAVANGVDTALGSMGFGENEIDTDLDKANWKRMNWWQKLESGTARGIEGIGGAIGLTTMSNEARAERIANETKYLDGVNATIPAEAAKSPVKSSVINPAQIAADAKKASEKAINTSATEVSTEEKRKDPFQSLIDAVSTVSEAEKSKMDEMIVLLKALIETVAPDKNGMLDALRNGTKISFNDIPDKRSLLASH